MRSKAGKKFKLKKKHLVQEAAARLRELILAAPPETRIGSLQEVAEALDVGIVTVQQAARILEHEGLLSVRRGPGGGYWGTRPDEAALERALAAYLRVHDFDYRDAYEMILLLDCEILPAAARNTNETLRDSVRAMRDRVESSSTPDERIELERELRDLLFKMVARPLMEFLCRVTGHLHVHPSGTRLFPGKEGVALWKKGKHRILSAILSQDEDLARFEAERYRQDVLKRLAQDRRR